PGRVRRGRRGRPRVVLVAALRGRLPGPAAVARPPDAGHGVRGYGRVAARAHGVTEQVDVVAAHAARLAPDVGRVGHGLRPRLAELDAVAPLARRLRTFLGGESVDVGLAGRRAEPAGAVRPGTERPGGLAAGRGRLVGGVQRQRLVAGDEEVLEVVAGRGRRRRFGRGLVGRRLGGGGFVVEQEDVVVEALDGDAGRLGRRLGLLAYRAADLVPELAQRGRLADALPDGGDVLLGPRLHALGQRLRGRVHRLLTRHDAGEVVEDVALDDLPAFTRTAQPAPVAVVLLRQPSRQRGDVGLAHRSPPTRGGHAPALVALVEREYTRPILRVWQGPISDISHSLRAAGDGADGSTAMLPACSPCRPRRPPRASAPARR